MRKAVYITLALTLMAGSPFSWAEERPEWKQGGEPKRVITPYGDFCPRCSKYGVAREHHIVSNDEALDAMRAYFINKGLRVEIVEARPRFIIAEVYKGDELVDKVVFDRRTGRIRSIF